MEDDCQKENKARPCVRNTSGLKMNGGVDLISSLPDEILHHILYFIPTKLAITTSVLSKRWRRVWCEKPSLSFLLHKTSKESIRKTLESYSATKIMSFHLCLDSETCLASKGGHDIDSLIKFAMSRNVEKLSLEFGSYTLPDFFFSNSSLKQLIIASRFSYLTPICTVSWTSLRNLSLIRSILSDESFPKILSGSPMLESLTLLYCGSLCCLDLSESLRLRRLTIEFCNSAPRKLKIVAPHINYLRLINFEEKCTLADASSLTEANIDTAYYLPIFWCIEVDPLKAVVFQVMMETMVEKFQNVENLTVGLSFLQMFSMAEFCGVPFPTFKIKTLTLETRVLRSMVPGIAKLLQNSPGLKKITVYITKDWNTAVEKYVNRYIDPQYLDPDQCWRFKDVVFPPSSEFKFAKPNLIGSFMEVLLGNTRTLETLVLQMGGYLNRSSFDELSQIALTLSHKNKVSIVLK